MDDDHNRNNIKVFINFYWKMQHSQAIYNFYIQCNNFSTTKTPDDGRIQPKHVVRKKGH
jgi:hypothetical protein